MSRSITVTWRTENYGRCSGCTTAFRLYDCVDFSDAEVAQVHEAAAQAGYSWDTSRCGGGPSTTPCAPPCPAPAGPACA